MLFRSKGYKINEGKKLGVENKTYNIAVILPTDSSMKSSAFFNKCIYGINEAAINYQYDTFIVVADANDTSVIKKLSEDKKIDGVILTRTYRKDEAVQYLKKEGIPFVAIGNSMDEQVVCVDYNHMEASRLLVQNILQKGIRTLAFLADDERFDVNRDRFQGYCEALQAYGVGQREGNTYLNVASKAQAEYIVEHLIFHRIEGIICADETMCEWVFQKLKKEHIRVPEQIHLASCHHSDILENYIPSVSTIKCNPKRLGKEACEVLMKMLENRVVRQGRYLDYELNV